MAKDPDRMARQTIGRSERSWGPGMHPNPKINYEGRVDPKIAARNAPLNGSRTEDLVRDMRAYKRLDTVQTGETLEDMYTAAGNTDRGGPAPPLVNKHDRQTRPDTPPDEPLWRMNRKWHSYDPDPS
jgi:hypothetical protein